MIEIVEKENAKFITHAGSFHADEVMATVLLEVLYDDIKLARVNEVSEESSAFIYDIGLGKYDHHQDDKVRRDNGIAYSSVGLIWRDYGLEVLKKLGIEEYAEDLFFDIDQDLIMPIDALDNGEGERASMTIQSVISLNNPFWNSSQSENEAFIVSVDFARNVFNALIQYYIDVYNNNELDWDAGYEWLDEVLKKTVLSQANKAGCFLFNEEGNAIDMWNEYGEEIITYYNHSSKHAQSGVYDINKMFFEPLCFERPEYNAITAYPIEQLSIIEEHYYKSGESLLEEILKSCIDSEISRIQGIDYVEQKIDVADQHILILEHFVPWKGTLLKSESPKANDIYITVFPSKRGGWNFQGVPLSPSSFDTRISVPEEWCGKRDIELEKLTGIKDARFIHPGGFIGGTDSFEATIALSKRIIEYTEGKEKL